MRFRAARMFRPACLQKRVVHIFSHTAMFCRKNANFADFRKFLKNKKLRQVFKFFISHCFPDT